MCDTTFQGLQSESIVSQLIDNAMSTLVFRRPEDLRGSLEQLSKLLSSSSTSPKSAGSGSRSASFAACLAPCRVVTPGLFSDNRLGLSQNASCRLVARLRSEWLIGRFAARPIKTERFSTDFLRTPADVGVATWLVLALDNSSLL